MEWNGNGNDEADGDEIGRQSKSGGCSDGPGLKNGDGDSQIPQGMSGTNMTQVTP
jgi:hypothetical protein